MSTALELDNNNHDGAARIHIINPSELLDAVGDSPSDTSKKLARLLYLLGFFTLLMDLATALYKPPRGVVFERHKLAYYLTLAGIFAAGLAEVSAAFWVSSSGQLVNFSGRRRALARAVLCASVVPLVAAIALGGFSVLVKG